MMRDSEFYCSSYRELPTPSASGRFAFVKTYDPLDPAGGEGDAPPVVLEKMAASRDCDAELLAILSDHDDVRVRCAVASNQNLPETLMWKLAADSDVHVRCRLTKNVSVTAFVLETLAEDEHQSVAACAERALAEKSTGSTIGKVIHWLFPRELKQTG